MKNLINTIYLNKTIIIFVCFMFVFPISIFNYNGVISKNSTEHIFPNSDKPFVTKTKNNLIDNYLITKDRIVSTFQSKETTYLDVTPISQTVDFGETFKIGVYLDPGEPIIGVQIDMSFDASLLQCDSVSNGNTSAWGTFFSPTIDNTNGEIQAAGVINYGSTVSFPTNCFNITFTTQNNAGTSLLDLNDVIITNETAQAISPVINDGSVTVEGNNPPVVSSPDPSDGATDVSISISQLSVMIDDLEDDLFSWSIETSPNIGSNSDSGDSDGLKVCSVSGLDFDTVYTWFVNATDIGGSDDTTSMVYTFTTEINNPPNIPASPSPVDGATDVNINVDLSWSGGDVDGDSVSYDVYFGTVSPPLKVVDNQSGTSYDPGTMYYTTVYYWKIVSWDEHGLSSVGSEWDFTTIAETNTPPMIYNPTPSDGATDVSISISQLSVMIDDLEDDLFSWSIETSPNIGSNSDSGDSDGLKVCSVSGLDFDTVYTWFVNATDIGGSDDTTSMVYTFTTLLNNPPNTPNIPSGPTIGHVDLTYDYTTSTTDSDDDTISYGWDWDGDYNVDEWTTFYTSGVIISTSHFWDSPGDYKIKVKAKDEHNAMSDWSENLTVTILEENRPPKKPDIDGPHSGKTRKEYSYDIVSTDSDGNKIKYKIDWGDGSTKTTDYYNSGIIVTEKHTWYLRGAYTIKVKAIDEYGAESGWAKLEVSMPKLKIFTKTPLIILLEILRDRFPLIEKITDNLPFFTDLLDLHNNKLNSV